MISFTQSTDGTIRITTPTYIWEWSESTDQFALFDSKNRQIGHGRHQPLIVAQNNGTFSPQTASSHLEGNRLSITYLHPSDASRLTVTWLFHPDFISLEPLRFESSTAHQITQIVYFPEPTTDSYKPSFYSHYAVVPGLCMSPSISPVVDLHSRLNVTAVLGSGAMRGPGLTQQWGLPAHYFCCFNTSDRWNAIGAKAQVSDAACWGLAELPDGDFRLELREIGLSPVLNVRSDLWGQYLAEGEVRLGFHFIIAFGENYHEAIRNYYKILLREKRIQPKHHSAKKRDVLLAPQYNTWGVESAKALRPEDLTQEIVTDIYNKFRASGMGSKTFVIDDKWEGVYGELKHDDVRFPAFDSLLQTIRDDGFYVGLWAAFLRCQNPHTLGLDESHLLQTHEGKPLWLAHQTARYGIFDVTQPIVQTVLRARAKEFIRRYNPDLIKFDFGYELPSLDIAAPADMAFAGERLLKKGLDVIVGAMKEENPDLVIMYYGLSPLLIEHYDLHSPDDLVYCIGDYDLETNRRMFFSSLCGELGMPTYSSSGYDWASALDIWFDAVASGSLGSLHCFDGDENGDQPTSKHITLFNGLCAVARTNSHFSAYPVDVVWHGGLRAGFAPSWERQEDNKTVLIALRPNRFDGKPASRHHKDILHTDLQVVVSSLTDQSIADSNRLGIVPFGVGRCVIRHSSVRTSAIVIEYLLDGGTNRSQVICANQQLELTFTENELREWVEVIFDS